MPTTVTIENYPHCATEIKNFLQCQSETSEFSSCFEQNFLQNKCVKDTDRNHRDLKKYQKKLENL